MKITWFGGTAFRLHIGGQIVVIDADNAPVADRNEVVSGADLVLESGQVAPVDGTVWRPRAAQRLMDSERLRPVEAWWIGAENLVIDADDERPLLIVGERLPDVGRWVGTAVVIVTSARATGLAAENFRPHLIALALPDHELDATFDQLRPMLDGTALVALEPGLAVEV